MKVTGLSRTSSSQSRADKNGGIVEISRVTRPGVLTGIDRVFYLNAFPVTAVIYGLYLFRDSDLVNPDPIRDGNL
jgi:hypothetical protein